MAFRVDGIAGLLLTLLLIAAALGGVGGVLRASVVKAQMTALREQRDDQERRIEFLERENTRVSGELQTEKEARLALEKVVTARDVLRQILMRLRGIERKLRIEGIPDNDDDT